VVGGGPHLAPGLRGGPYLQSTIFAHVQSRMRIAQEKIFGPVLSMIDFEDEAEAVQLVNDVALGLVAGL
jgi:(Z)-2-((N-methylformamido)methylene)-5-hydroxybutyrolactone dehydrogenase